MNPEPPEIELFIESQIIGLTPRRTTWTFEALPDLNSQEEINLTNILVQAINREIDAEIDAEFLADIRNNIESGGLQTRWHHPGITEGEYWDLNSGCVLNKVAQQKSKVNWIKEGF